MPRVFRSNLWRMARLSMLSLGSDGVTAKQMDARTNEK